MANEPQEISKDADKFYSVLLSLGGGILTWMAFMSFNMESYQSWQLPGALVSLSLFGIISGMYKRELNFKYPALLLSLSFVVPFMTTILLFDYSTEQIINSFLVSLLITISSFLVILLGDKFGRTVGEGPIRTPLW